MFALTDDSIRSELSEIDYQEDDNRPGKQQEHNGQDPNGGYIFTVLVPVSCLQYPNKQTGAKWRY